MLFVRVMGILLLTVSAAAAQVATTEEVQPFVSAHTMQSNGRIKETITNQGSVAMTAFRVRFRCPSAPPMFFFYDSVINPTANPVIAAKASKSIELPVVPANCALFTDAAIFADGTAYGGKFVLDPVDSIRSRRVAYLAELYGLEPLVADVMGDRMTMDAMTKWLKERKTKIDADDTRNQEDKNVCTIALLNLLADVNKQHIAQPMVPHTYRTTGPDDVNILTDSLRAARVNDWLQGQKVAVTQALAQMGIPQARKPIAPPLQ